MITLSRSRCCHATSSWLRVDDNEEVALVAGVSSSTQSPPPALEGFRSFGQSVGKEFGEVVEADGIGALADQALEIDVEHVVVHRDADIARIAAHADVDDVVALRETVDRGVRLDEPSVPLRVEVGEDFIELARVHIEPRRDLGERPIEIGRLEDEQPADHLRPGRAALRWCADDDVARSELEPVPARAVEQEVPVALFRRVDRDAHGRGSPWCLSSMSAITERMNSSASLVMPPSTPP